MNSPNSELASLLDDDDKTSISGSSSATDRKPVFEDGLLRPETSVFLEDGLFVRIASFSEGRELLRLCTLAKSDIEPKCKLALNNGGIKKDPRRLERLPNEESWSTVLRERIALDKDLVFTAGDDIVMKDSNMKYAEKAPGQSSLNKVFFSQPTSVNPSWRGAICGREQVMRTGVHRAIFTPACSVFNLRIGILGAFALQGQLRRREYEPTGADALAPYNANPVIREYDTYTRTTVNTETGFNVPLAACHNATPRSGQTMQVGLEIDVERKIMRVYRSSTNFRREKAQFAGSVSIQYPSSDGFCWAVYAQKLPHGLRRCIAGTNECAIERIPGGMSFESLFRPAPAIVPADSQMIERYERSRRQSQGRFSNTNTRQHFDPYSSPPPSP